MSKRLITPALVAVGLLFGIASNVQASEALAKSKNCMACHAVDKKMVGPSYKDVAAKYKGKGAEATLAAKIKKGGVGAWGNVPMPPKNVTDAEAASLAKWVMSL